GLEFAETTKSQFRFIRTRSVVLRIFAVAVVVGVVAFVTSTQYFPSVPTGAVAAHLVANCGVSTTTALTVTPATVTAGSAFALVYSCSSRTATISLTNVPITKTTTKTPAIGAGGMPT